MNRLPRLLFVFLINVILLFAVLEVGLRLVGARLPGQAGIAIRMVTTGSPYPAAWQPAWQQNRDHYYALRPGLTDALQYGSPSVSFSLTTIELWAGGGIGFRTPPIDYFVDAVVVGDSFTMCFTEQAECWVDALAAQSGRGFVNLGQPVTGTTSHARILRDFGAPLVPPLVIWQFFGNDFNDDYGLAVFRDEQVPLASADNATPAEPNDLGAWLRRHSTAYALLETVVVGRYLGMPASEALFIKPYRARFGAYTTNALQFGGLYEQQALDMRREENQIGLALSRSALQEARDLVASWNGQMLLVMIPTREEIYRAWTEPQLGAAALEALGSARLAMQGLCAELDLACFDAYEALRAASAGGEVALYFSDDMHLNAQGNRALAEALNAELNARGLWR